ncbi:MAG: 4'-phosphopantetheinyl transferase superfamily protein [Anaerolineae bacterium]|nr:4'-phosphopantetheinyl transferase superfamily protein [Anaerolineae bacterium]
MTGLPHNLPDEDEVHAVSLDLDLPGSLVEQVSGYLGESEWNRADRMGTEALRQRFIAVHGILRLLLGRYLGIPPETVEIKTGQYGKLFARDIEFSLSHSRSRAVMAFGCAAPVGVDVEMIDAAVNLRQVASLAFSPAEFEHWQAIPVERQRLAFYQMWTAKEALLKALGTGMRLSPRKFTICVTRGELYLQDVEDSAFSSLLQRSHLYQLSPGEHAVGMLVVVGNLEYRLREFHPTAGDIMEALR